MKIEISSQKRNDLLKRREITFTVVHEKTGTPSRLEIRERIAAMMNADIGSVYIIKMETKTGSTVTVGEANVYDSAEQAKYTEPDHIVSRNVPKEKEE
ncbi:MAG: 30S ribosomal protein S24e [Candidatus Bathyarchaeia archaeon]